MSYLDVINYLRLDDVDRGAKNAEHLNDLRDRAGMLAKRTGHEPMSWYEFKQTQPREETHGWRNMGIGAIAGAAIGGIIGLLLGGVNVIPGAIVGAFIGGAAGSFANTENMIRDKQVKQYENYLDTFEISVGHNRALSQQLEGLGGKTTHAVDLERQVGTQMQR